MLQEKAKFLILLFLYFKPFLLAFKTKIVVISKYYILIIYLWKGLLYIEGLQQLTSKI